MWLGTDSSSSLGTQRPPIAWGPVSLMRSAALCPGLGPALCSLPRRNEFILPIAGTACADSRVLPSDLITHKPAPARDALDASRGCLGPFGLLLPTPLNKRNLYLTVLEARSSMSGCQRDQMGALFHLTTSPVSSHGGRSLSYKSIKSHEGSTLMT